MMPPRKPRSATAKAKPVKGIKKRQSKAAQLATPVKQREYVRRQSR